MRKTAKRKPGLCWMPSRPEKSTRASCLELRGKSWSVIWRRTQSSNAFIAFIHRPAIASSLLPARSMRWAEAWSSPKSSKAVTRRFACMIGTGWEAMVSRARSTLPEALASIDWSAGPVRPVKGTSMSDMKAGVAGESLVESKYFQLDRFRVEGTFDVPGADRMSIWIVLDGVAELMASAYRRVFRRGETVLVPASAGNLSWYPVAPLGSATLLGIRLP